MGGNQIHSAPLETVKGETLLKEAGKSKKPISRKAQVELTKSNILGGATELFLEYGYEVASVNVLAKQVGCSKETIYKYFDSKEGLFLAAIDNILEDTLVSVVDLDIQHMSLLEGLRHVSYKTLEKACSERYTRLRTLIATCSKDMPQIGSEYYQYIEERSYKILASFFQKYIDQKQLKDISAYRMSTYFWGMMLHNLFFQMLTQDKTKITSRKLKVHANQVIEDFLLAFGC